MAAAEENVTDSKEEGPLKYEIVLGPNIPEGFESVFESFLPEDHSEDVAIEKTVEPKQHWSKDSSSSVHVFARWRPLCGEEVKRGDDEITRNSTVSENTNLFDLEISGAKKIKKKKRRIPIRKRMKKPKEEEEEENENTIMGKEEKEEENDFVLKPFGWMGSEFSGVIDSNEDNFQTYRKVIQPYLSTALNGGTTSCFCYGMTGSGKTHTTLGYEDQFGLFYQACTDICDHLKTLSEKEDELFLNISFSELHLKKMFDLMNDDHEECFVREGPEGYKIKGKTIKREDGTVYSPSISQISCVSADEVAIAVAKGITRRAVGSSNIHDESSRSHAFLEIEIVNQELIDAREAVLEAESIQTLVGKNLTDKTIKEDSKKIYKRLETAKDGTRRYLIDIREGETYDVEGVKQLTQEFKIVETEYLQMKEELKQITERARKKFPCIGGRFVFIDLAGSEHGDDSKVTKKKLTPKEQREGREINMSLMALNNVIRAQVKKLERIPYRESTLTKVLHRYLTSSNSENVMIACLSPSVMHAGKTIKTLKYAYLMAQNQDPKVKEEN